MANELEQQRGGGIGNEIQRSLDAAHHPTKGCRSRWSVGPSNDNQFARDLSVGTSQVIQRVTSCVYKARDTAIVFVRLHTLRLCAAVNEGLTGYVKNWRER